MDGWDGCGYQARVNVRGTVAVEFSRRRDWPSAMGWWRRRRCVLGGKEVCYSLAGGEGGDGAGTVDDVGHFGYRWVWEGVKGNEKERWKERD